MEAIISILVIVAVLVISILLGLRRHAREEERWRQDCAGACDLVVANQRYKEFLTSISIEECNFRTVFSVFANFARVERMATKEDKLNELSTDDFRVLVGSKNFDEAQKTSEVDFYDYECLVTRVLESLGPFREGKADSRGLYYELLYKAFTSELKCEASLNSSAFGIFDIITLGRASALNNN